MTAFLCIDKVPTVRGVYAGVCETYIVHVYMYGMKYNIVTEKCTLLSVTCYKNVHYSQSLAISMDPPSLVGFFTCTLYACTCT